MDLAPDFNEFCGLLNDCGVECVVVGWSTRVAGRCGDHTVSFIGRAALIKNKKASGRLQDLADIESLGE